MFEICNDKTYFLAETTAKNKTIEITLVKDSHGSLLNEHEIKLDLCRAVLELQRGGYIVTKVRALDYDIENVVDVFHLPEFEEARENPMPDIVSGVITSNFDSGASFHLPCKVNKKTREVFAVEVPAQPCGDDSFRNATVNVDGVDRSLLNLTDIVSEYDSDDYDGVLDALYHVQAKNDYWENDGESLTDLIHKYRWYILKYGAYALLAVALFRLQSIPGLLEIGGVRPLPVAALAILVATMERELPGVLFCIFCGYLCDLYSVAPMGFYMLLFTILGLAAGLIIRNYLQPSLPIIMAAVLIAAFFCRLVLFLFRYPLAGVTGAAPVLLRYDLPHAVYSVVLAVPLYYPVRALHRMAEERTDTRL